MPAIIANFAVAMPTGLNGQSEFIEHTRLAACVIQKGVMCWIQFLAARESSLHGQGDPVLEVQPLAHDRSELDSELRRCIEKKGTAGLQNTAALKYPRSAPRKILSMRYFIIVSILVILADVKRWISKNGVDHAGLHATKHVKAICVEECPKRSRHEWAQHGKKNNESTDSVEVEDISGLTSPVRYPHLLLA